MRLAVTIWENRVSPVFDTARELLLINVDGEKLLDRSLEELGQESSEQRVDRIRELDVDTLICGAISRPFEEMLVSAGVRVISHIVGPTEIVLGAFVSGQIERPVFQMPGYRHKRPSSSRTRCQATQNHKKQLNKTH